MQRLDSVADNPSRPPTGVPPDILDKMNDYIDNMDNVVTNEKAVLDQLVVVNSKKPPPSSHKPQPSSPSQMKPNNSKSVLSTKGE